MNRWAQPHHGSKAMTQAQAETRLIDYLCNVRPHLRAGITVDSIQASYNVPENVAKYRLALAQDRWRREDQARAGLGL